MRLSPSTELALHRAYFGSVNAGTRTSYRTRRRRAGWIRIGLTAAALAAFALPLIGSY